MSWRGLGHFAAACIIGLAPLASAHAYFGEDPVNWLNQMTHALGTVNYQGTFVYIHNDQAETMQVFHRIGEHGTQERLVSLNGTAREVVRNDKTVQCILPDDRAVFVEKRHAGGTLTQGIPLNAAKLGAYYDFKLEGVGRIAGRTSRLIVIQPKDGFRYGYRLWLDEDTALPLRSELVNESGQPIEKMMFTEISIGGDIPEKLLQASTPAKDFAWHVRNADEHDINDVATAVRFESMPPGFHISENEINGEKDDPSYHLVLTDGLSSVSVFAEPLEKGKPSLAGLSRLGAVNAFGVRLKDYHVTVVGEVPEDAVIHIGEAVHIDESAVHPIGDK